MDWRTACAYSDDKIAYHMVPGSGLILYAEIGEPPVILLNFNQFKTVDLDSLPIADWYPLNPVNGELN